MVENSPIADEKTEEMQQRMQNQRVQRASDTTPQCEELGFSDLGALGNIRPQIPRDQYVKYSVRMLRLSLAE